ncbi:A/G-specific adenine glycosylase [Pseudomarimonas arenosa]|uniref:Adenine DNA glycosylase n=1 Tax=Pseudomarimonas arenosa TaxID=2774145 RepID=A0AAW3ZNU1_9GAMM|nr:A/G-specific adenine glycosylase [Pseudomarimonas arenosa]MBD8525936.1 A/G-specific adenine glycosylase [Pseudomarimonas arenosa]
MTDGLNHLRPRFADRLLTWFDQHGRHDLPWQHPRTPYRVWLSEIMLQQTQVATVVPYFQRFVARFPDLPCLAAAQRDDVLALWAGLGYYSRARNLHAAAQRCVEEHAGRLPDDIDALCSLPGIGRSTAAAILSQAFDRPAAILDGNVKRVLCRLLAIEQWPGLPAVEKQLWQVAEALMGDIRPADYTQAIMDFGATLCRRSRPDCGHCPFRSDCLAFAQSRVAEVPTARPKRELPRRHCVVVLLQDADQHLLLQRRDGPGVWNGLWSLPEFSDLDAADAFLLQFGARALESELPAVDHSFSHYHLQLRPRVARVPHRVNERSGDYSETACFSGMRWCSRGDIAKLGLPAPIRRLVATHLIDPAN